ncbi:hypothetical protein CHELA41_50574 [Hyphomicrobiales bacterium]|nr:hypothetical protein CHELA41_50574 [Hyphomicrobiales bacterium]
MARQVRQMAWRPCREASCVEDLIADDPYRTPWRLTPLDVLGAGSLAPRRHHRWINAAVQQYVGSRILHRETPDILVPDNRGRDRYERPAADRPGPSRI